MEEDEIGKIDVDLGFLKTGARGIAEEATELEGRFVKAGITDMEKFFEVIQNSTKTIDICFYLLRKRLNEKENEDESN
jgi:hypothetical protein